ncbi:hypothetical protein P0Y35_15210 [Kiritimatiellaeota bacterium B1221]|nr:hypothetical protein [Kiritimatiellaeota bacterium B1221]
MAPLVRELNPVAGSCQSACSFRYSFDLRPERPVRLLAVLSPLKPAPKSDERSVLFLHVFPDDTLSQLHRHYREGFYLRMEPGVPVPVAV